MIILYKNVLLATNLVIRAQEMTQINALLVQALIILI